jgi:recombination protein RecA
VDNSQEKQQKLEKTLASVRNRWGSQAVHRLRPDSPNAGTIVPTGFPTLDEALVIGGLPRGRISEIVGIPTSGMATLALKVVGKAQKQTGAAVYIDMDHNFDPDYAARCGLNLSRLVLVRPNNLGQGLAILQDFILNGKLNILVFDMPFKPASLAQTGQELAAMLARLIAPLSRSECALVFLTSLPPGNAPVPDRTDEPSFDGYPPSSTLPHYAAIRLFIRKERWIYKERDIRGYQAQVQVIKNKLGPAGKMASIAITFNGTVAANTYGE